MIRVRHKVKTCICCAYEKFTRAVTEQNDWYDVFEESDRSGEHRPLCLPRSCTTLFVLHSAEHENYPSHKCQNANNFLLINVKMPTIVDILIFISRINNGLW